MKNNVPNRAKKLITTTAVPMDSERLANSRMGSSGSGVRSSISMNTASATTPARMTPSV